MNQINPDHTNTSKLLFIVTSLVQKYDTYFTSLVAILPVRWQRYFSTLGHITLPIIWGVALLIICFGLLTAGYVHLAYIGAAIVACIPLATILKLSVRRARPDTPYAKNMKITSYSFPSSHTYSATISAGFLAILAFSFLPLTLAAYVAGVLALVTVIIGISRVHIGAHYPTDVTAGWILGAIVLYMVTTWAL